MTFETSSPHPLVQCSTGSWALGGVSHTPPSSSLTSKGCAPLGLCEDACWQRRQGNGSFHHPQLEHLLYVLGKMSSILLEEGKKKKKMLLLKEFENHLDPSALPIPVNSSFVSLPRSTGRPSAPDPLLHFSSVHSVAQLCLTLCDPMDCSTPDLPVHRQLPEFTRTHVH